MICQKQSYKAKKKAGGMTVMYLDRGRKVLKECFGNYRGIITLTALYILYKQL